MENYNLLKHIHITTGLVETHLFFFFNEQYLYFYNLKNASLTHTAVIVFLHFPKILSN